ncbi:MAG: hypothetical protein K2N90_01355 [Lachnospiraceae bacterium]|nr:hypothetical protein [Lachnospiraceae bacterium]
MNKTKVAIVVSQFIETIQSICGWILTALMVLTLTVCAVEGELEVSTTIISIIVLGIGVYLIIVSKKRKRLRLSYKKYVAALSVDPTGSIQSLAATVGVSADVCRTDLQKMINKKFFDNAFIDKINDRFVIPVELSGESRVGNYQDAIVNGSHSNVEYVACDCPNCGGANRIIKGQTAECDFCGSPING